MQHNAEEFCCTQRAEWTCAAPMQDTNSICEKCEASEKSEIMSSVRTNHEAAALVSLAVIRCNQGA